VFFSSSSFLFPLSGTARPLPNLSHRESAISDAYPANSARRACRRMRFPPRGLPRFQEGLPESGEDGVQILQTP
jgi:hypothetical protein